MPAPRQSSATVRRRWSSIAAVLAMCLVLAACGGASDGSGEDTSGGGGSEGGGTAIEHSIQMPGVISYELNLPTLVADANGFLADEGIEISEYVTGSGGTLRQAVIAGEYDVGLFATVHPVLAREGGSNWKAIFSAHDLEIFSLIARTELEGEVQEVADLADRRVGFSRPGAGSWFLGSALLQDAGLDPDTDLEYVALGGDPGVIYTSLQDGQIDAFSSWEPTTTRAIEDGVAYPVVPIWEEDVHREFIGESALSMVLIAREEAIEEDPEYIQALVDAHTAGIAWINDHESSEIAELVLNNDNTSELLSGLDQELVVKMIDRIRGGFGEGCLDREAYQTELDLLLQYEVVSEELPFEEFADTTFAGEC